MTQIYKQTISVLVCVGTRPEAIKLAPVIQSLRALSEPVKVIVCLTGQHSGACEQILELFGIEADEHLNYESSRHDLPSKTSDILVSISDCLTRLQPQAVVAQGDTTTVLAAAMASFYAQVPFFHVEAGLRSGIINSPFPEEMNRQLADRLATRL